MGEQNDKNARHVNEVTQAMHDFHKEAWNKLDSLQAYALQLRTVDGPSRAAILKEIAALVSFIETDMWAHFRQEEEQVYSVLKQILPPNRRRSVMAMEKDHQSIGRLVAEVKPLLQEAQAMPTPSSQLARQIEDVCLRLVQLMREHINKENLIYQELGEIV